MKKCPYCKNDIPQQVSECPFCGAYVKGVTAGTTAEKSSSKTGESKAPQSKESRQTMDSRKKNTPKSLVKIYSSVSGYLSFLKSNFVCPSLQRRVRRNENTYYGYITAFLTILLSAGSLTRLVTGLISKYNLLSDISILPSANINPNPIFFFIKSVIFFLVYYLGFPIIAYWIKKLILKRSHEFHFWITQYEGANTIGLLFVSISFLLSLISPLLWAILISFLLLLTAMTYGITFVGSFYKTVNETAIDNIYLSLIGGALHLFVVMTLAYLMFP